MRVPRRGLAMVVIGLLAGLLTETPARAAEFNVRDYGATGNGSTNDTPAIQRAIDAAAGAGGINIVRFPSGTYRSANSIHLRSNITIQLDSGATILGSPNDDYDPPEPNPWDDYQDYGHSHFHNAMIWGDRLTNIAFQGSGTIDGGGHMITGNSVPSGRADKLLSIKRCTNLTLRGITLRRGGHFMALINGCGGVTIDNFKTIWSDSGVRDGINLINSWDVTVTNSRIEGSDDALAFKSDYALGQTYVSRNIRVSDTTVYSHENNALQFGSETCGDFRDIRFDRITILGAGKAGIGMVSMDGAIIEDVHFSDITITKATSAVFMKLGQRRRCPGSPPAGRIRNITLTNVSGSNLTAPAQPGGGGAREYSSTITGMPGVPLENITFNNVDFEYPGGHPASDADIVPGEHFTTYPPRDYGTRPSYGWWMRHIRGITFNDSDVSFVSNDNRPAFIADDGANVVINRTRAERGTGSAYDIGFSGINGYAVRDSSNTSGGALRVRATNSTPLPDGNRVEAESGTCDGTIDSNHAGFSGTGFCNTTNATGASATVTVNAAAVDRAELRFGYANGSSADRPATLLVNGAVFGTVSFPPTGGWPNWRTVTAPVSLRTGTNTIRLVATTSGGLPNYDYVDVVVPGPQPREYQAEDCTIIQGAVESNHAGFTGTGFVNGENVTGSGIECTVTGPATSVAIRFANGTTTTRPMTLNGVTVNFPGTGAWTNWDTATVTVSLGEGTHVLRLIATTSNGGPNLDKLTVT